MIRAENHTVAKGDNGEEFSFTFIKDSERAKKFLATGNAFTMLIGEDKVKMGYEIEYDATPRKYVNKNGEDDDSDATNGIQLKDVTGDSRPLVTSEAATIRLHTTFESVDYNDGIFTITGLKVVKGDMELTSITPFTVKTVNP